MQVHGRMPAVDGGGLKADMDFGSRKLVRSSNDAVTQMRGTMQIVFDLERLKLVAVRVHETRFQFLRTDVNTDK